LVVGVERGRRHGQVIDVLLGGHHDEILKGDVQITAGDIGGVRYPVLRRSKCLGENSALQNKVFAARSGK